MCTDVPVWQIPGVLQSSFGISRAANNDGIYVQRHFLGLLPDPSVDERWPLNSRLGTFRPGTQSRSHYTAVGSARSSPTPRSPAGLDAAVRRSGAAQLAVAAAPDNRPKEQPEMHTPAQDGNAEQRLAAVRRTSTHTAFPVRRACFARPRAPRAPVLRRVGLQSMLCF